MIGNAFFAFSKAAEKLHTAQKLSASATLTK
jgi:hypothetical protein